MGYLLLFLVLTTKLFNHLKKINMKNSFKMGALALVIAVSFTACKGKGASGSADSDTSKKADTSMKMAPDTAKKDTSKKADTSKMAKDTSKKKM